MQTIINIIVFLLILTAIITIHEFGHFIAAKIFNVYCGSFSIGMGPKIFSKKGKETEFQIRAIPIGGFVTMAGEADQEENEEFTDVPIERTLNGKKTWQKVIIFLAGVFMNFVLAISIMFVLNCTVGTIGEDTNVLGNIVDNSPAMKAGLQANDQLISIENADSHKSYSINKFSDLSTVLTKDSQGVDSKETTMIIIVKRDNKTITKTVVVPFNSSTNTYQLGVQQATRKMKLSESFIYTFQSIGTMSLAIFTALKQLVLNFSGAVEQMSGPVGIYTVTASVTESGQIANIFYLMALLSVNIGIFNLLPIPGLDGCQTLFAIIEGVIKRELPIKVKYFLQLAGLSLLLLFMFFITYQDIIRLLK